MLLYFITSTIAICKLRSVKGKVTVTSSYIKTFSTIINDKVI